MPSEAKVPTYDKLIWPVLIAIKALGGSATNDELLDKVIELERIPDAVQNIMHTERQTKLGYRLAWAKTYLGKAGGLENPTHGVWAITEKGKALTADEVKQIPAEVRKLYKVEKGEKPKDHQEPEEVAGISLIWTLVAGFGQIGRTFWIVLGHELRKILANRLPPNRQTKFENMTVATATEHLTLDLHWSAVNSLASMHGQPRN